MIELLDRFIIYVTKILGAPSELDMNDRCEASRSDRPSGWYQLSDELQVQKQLPWTF